MSHKVRVAGTWRDASPYVKVGGTWKLANEVWNKDESVGFSALFSQKLSIPFVAEAFLKESDGRIVALGETSCTRFTEDGDVDSNFSLNIGTGTDATGGISSAALQSDGKIVVAGNFTSWNGTTVGSIVRLNSDGTRDTAFTTNTGTGANNQVNSIAAQSDDKILVGGGFTSWNGTTAGRIVRLNADGTLDTVFMANVGTGAGLAGPLGVWSFALQPDGKIIVGGSFDTWNGTTVGRIVRLNADGTRDTAFTTNVGTGANNTIQSLGVQSDGKIVLGGLFTTWRGTTVNRIVRLNADGTRDTAFTTNTGTGANDRVEKVALQSDDKILVGGAFTSWNGTTVGYIVRLDSDGTLDTAYMSSPIGTGGNSFVTAMLVYSENKLFVSGFFTSWDGKTATSIARLYNNEWRTSFVKGGLVDRSWDDVDQTGEFGTAASNSVYSVAVQSDGKILVGGNFPLWNGTTVNRIVRLNSDGTLDTAFTTNTGTGANSEVSSIALQSDGKILVVGQFSAWNGTAVGRIVRLNSDGTRDTAFSTNIGTGGNFIVYSVAVQSDGKILVGGNFPLWNGTTVNRIVRLNSDGTRDTVFTTNTGTGANGAIYSVSVQSDGKIVVGGIFTTWNGTSVNRIVRLNSDGTRDTAFTTNISGGPNSTVRSIAVQSDGKIVVGGEFTAWGVQSVGRIVRLASNGTPDVAFTMSNGTGANSTIYSIAVQSDGKILVGGQFTSWNGTTVGRFVRLDSNGTLDTALTTNTGTAADNTVWSTAAQSDGKILVGGGFTSWNGTTIGRFARLNSDGTNETLQSFANSRVESVAVQPDSKILVGGQFPAWNGTPVGYIVRLNSDGTRDTAFTTNTGTGGNSIVRSIAVQPDNKIVVGGEFTTWNGTSVGFTARLNSDGTLDTAFTANTGTGPNGFVRSIAVQPDNKIVVGGEFTTWNGTSVRRIVRLNADGTLDTAFITNTGTGANDHIYTLAVQTDGKIVVGGRFTSWNGTSVGYVVRLNSNGTLDTAFMNNIGDGAIWYTGDGVYSIAVQSDGKILVGGSFEEWDYVYVVSIVRLNADGTSDTAFTTNTGYAIGFGYVYSMAVQSDGKILVGGSFVEWNSTTFYGIVRLNSDGTLDTAFTTNTGTGTLFDFVQTMAIQSDGKILVGGSFTTFGRLDQFRRYFVRIGGEIAA